MNNLSFTDVNFDSVSNGLFLQKGLAACLLWVQIQLPLCQIMYAVA